MSICDRLPLVRKANPVTSFATPLTAARENGFRAEIRRTVDSTGDTNRNLIGK